MSNSPHIDSVVLTGKHSGKRTHKVQAFVIHHMAAKWTGKRCAEYFRDTPSRQASANYCIGYDGDVVLNVEEENRAWTSSSNWADQRAITYELANSKTGEPWEVSDKTIRKLIVMLAEQHKRYGLKKATYTGDTSGTLWRHDFFAKTNCPGAYLGGKFAYIAQEVNKILDEKPTVESGVHVKPVAKPAAKPTSTSGGFVRSEKENGRFQVGKTLYVFDKPDETSKHVATYKISDPPVVYHTIHYGNGYLWLQYTRDGGKGEGYIACRTYTNGKLGPMFGEILGDAPKPKPVVKKTYVKLSATISAWRIYPLGVKPVAGKEKGFLNPKLHAPMEYEVLGYEDNKSTAVIRTTDFGKGKIFLDSDATIYSR